MDMEGRFIRMGGITWDSGRMISIMGREKSLNRMAVCLERATIRMESLFLDIGNTI